MKRKTNKKQKPVVDDYESYDEEEEKEGPNVNLGDN